jgi:hypothetical protein
MSFHPIETPDGSTSNSRRQSEQRENRLAASRQERFVFFNHVCHETLAL